MSTPIYHTDTAIVGAGTAGLTAHRTLLKNGIPSLLIEKNHKVHTTCAAVGCMPSKLLIAAAHSRYIAQQALHVFGSISQLDNTPNDTSLWTRIQSERDRFTSLVHQGTNPLLLSTWAPNIPLSGLTTSTTASLSAYSPTDEYPFTLNLQTHTTSRILKAKKLIQASGSVPFIPTVWHPHLTLLNTALHTNETIFELNKTPKSIAVIGAGVIGVELSSAFHQLGTNTHLISPTAPSQLLSLSPASSSSYSQYLAQQGINLHLETTILQAYYDNNTSLWTLTLSNTTTVQVEKVLLATGRKPNILPDTTTIPLNHQLIIGDASSTHPLLHEAALDGAHAYDWRQQADNRVELTPLRIVFGYPQVAIVGNVPPNQPPHGHVCFADQGRSRVQAENVGHLSIWFNENKELMAAEIIHPRAEHLAPLLAWATQARQTCDQLLSMPFFHPVIEEGLRTALRTAQTKINSLQAGALSAR